MCYCDDYPNDHVNTPEDIQRAYRAEATMCVKKTQRYLNGKHVNISSCYAPHPDFPHIGVEDGGELTYDGCRHDMHACQHRAAEPVRAHAAALAAASRPLVAPTRRHTPSPPQTLAATHPRRYIYRCTHPHAATTTTTHTHRRAS